jgi:hypothetical protein
MEWLRGFDDDVDVFSQVIYPVHEFSVFHSTDQIVHHLQSTVQNPTLTQGDLLQEALAVTFAKDQTQAFSIPVKVPLAGGRYAELIEWNGSKRVNLRFWKTDTIPSVLALCLQVKVCSFSVLSICIDSRSLLFSWDAMSILH